MRTTDYAVLDGAWLETDGPPCPHCASLRAGSGAGEQPAGEALTARQRASEAFTGGSAGRVRAVMLCGCVVTVVVSLLLTYGR
ncbi:hypothetical protein [Streptomyces sp. NPDC006368]|uniref:hypothetical protein n=1 Tax=Streptomyces sp. NPDC006368 TaxID=3156760 RepID=UPI0033B8F5C7